MEDDQFYRELAYLDAEYDTVDRSSDEVLPTTNKRKASMG
jgi:hypothetical protein